MKQLRTYHYFVSKYLTATGLVLIGLFLSLPNQADVELTLGIAAVIAMVGMGYGIRNLFVNQKEAALRRKATAYVPQSVEVLKVPSPKIHIRGLVSFQIRCTYVSGTGEARTVFSQELVLTEQSKHIQNGHLAPTPKVTVYEGDKGVLVDAFV